MSHLLPIPWIAMPPMLQAVGVGAALAAATGVLLLSWRLRALERRLAALERIESFGDR